MSESTAVAAPNPSFDYRGLALIEHIDADGPGRHRAADASFVYPPDRSGS